VVDNFDFPINTWTSHHKKEFVAMVDHCLHSPAVTDKTFVFLTRQAVNE